VELDTSPGRFQFIINGQPLFMKGGNWIPCDSLYGRIAGEKVERLVEEAAQANFNCLRIWGGGRFEMDDFYDACDRLGILVWQDFMSACAPLPAHEDWFVDEFRREAEHQIRRLRSRACLLVWCGNNEVGGMYGWFSDRFKGEIDPGWKLYHRLLPRLLDDLSPHVPYWPTSPYGGRESTDDPKVGDDHHWVVMRPEKEYWSDPFYWNSAEIPIFNSEYGYGGPCCIESTRQYLDTDEPNLFEETGRQHTNSFYDIPRVNWSIREHYRDPSDLSLEEYILLGGLCQGLNLGYSLESLRANQQTMGGVFWMYDDAWGENGWTIIDYYLRRKIAYYRVMRSLAPQRLVLRRGGQAFGGADDEVVLLVLNDSGRRLDGRAELGYMRYDGSAQSMKEIEFSVEPRSKALVGSAPVPDRGELEPGTIMAIPDGKELLEPVIWEHCRFRKLCLPEPDIRITQLRKSGEDLDLTLRCDVFAHAVHFSLGAEYGLSDHYFDLLPGVSKEVRISDGAALESSALVPRAVMPPRPEACDTVSG
jgi:beta-mannosidase